MKSIVHLTTAHPRDDTRIFHKQCKSISNIGYETHLVVADGLGNSVIDNVSVHDVGKQPTRFSRMVFSTMKVYKLALKLQGDIYHLHDPELIIVGLLLKYQGFKVVFDSHEDVPVQILSKSYLPKNLRKIIAIFYSRFEKFALKKFDGIVVATPTIFEKLQNYNDNIIELKNYPILEEVNHSSDWKNKNEEICYVGAISINRGACEMIAALNCMKGDLKLNLVGDFVDNQLHERLKSHRKWSSVNYHGRLDRRGVLSILNRSMIGLAVLHPTKNYIDAFPIKVFEYMAAGIPIIVSDFPILKNIVNKSNCGIAVDPLDPETIAKHIGDLLVNKDKAKSMGENGRKAVLEEFNWEKEKIKIRPFYKVVLG